MERNVIEELVKEHNKDLVDKIMKLHEEYVSSGFGLMMEFENEEDLNEFLFGEEEANEELSRV